MTNLVSHTKWWLYPGTNLNLRLRKAVIPRNLGRAAPGSVRYVLDAGCGNGALAYESYKRGNHVLAISIKDSEVTGCRSLFHSYLNISSERLRFEKHNLYDLAELALPPLDEIICTEVLEHIRGDAAVCREFFRFLKPGGLLHVTSPNAEHPVAKAETIDSRENGGHVRAGYTEESFRSLLESAGFQVEEVLGIGGERRQQWNRRILAAERRFGRAGAVMTYAASLPFVRASDSGLVQPYCYYLRARKPVV